MANSITKRTVSIAFAASLVAGIAFGIAGADVGPTLADMRTSGNPREWVNPDTGEIDYARTPPRIGFATELVPSGIVWVDTVALFENREADRRFPAFTQQVGGDLVGYFLPSDGTIVTSDGGRLSPSGEPSPVTTAATAATPDK